MEAAPRQPPDQMADDLAPLHERAPRLPGRLQLRHHIRELTAAVLEIHTQLETEPELGRRHPREAEWLLDNRHVVLEALNQVEEGLPRKFLDQLPRLGKDGRGQKPRIFDLAGRLVVADADFSTASWLVRFLARYQERVPLTIGELWALPSFLRLTVLEKLAEECRRLCDRSLEPEQEAAGEAVADSAPRPPTIAWAVLHLRALAAADWKSIVEATSLVDRRLRSDPSGDFPHMDFESRDRYRKAVEELARGSGTPEPEVADRAVRLARQARVARERHVGFYLIDDGRDELESRLGCRPSLRRRLLRVTVRRGAALYLGSIALLTAGLLALLAVVLWQIPATLPGLAAGLLLGLSPALTVAVAVTNWLVTHALPPRALPKLDFSTRIPHDARTLVVVPCLLARKDEIGELLDRLELHYLGNRDPNLYFALLTDLADADAEARPADRPLLEAAEAGIAELNRRYPRPGPPRFHWLHRRRIWNPRERRFVGWERKRGKLAELNRLLLGDEATTYVHGVETLRLLLPVPFVLTLDADTRLPPGTAQRLAGALAHPLNRADFVASKNDPCCGYTVLQPRLETLPEHARATRFTRLFHTESGLDLYTRAVSDAYFDLLGEGIYAGKGIYDVAAFERSLESRVPDNRLLSHDLFEGIHGRAALVSDAVLFEDYPPNIAVFLRRLHRWVRGDWQLLPWLLPRVPVRGGRAPNPLSAIDRWKILDNLRRTLLAPSLVLMLLAGWTLLPGPPLLWTLIALATLATPILLAGATAVRQQAHTRGRRTALSQEMRPLRTEAARWALGATFLLHEALVSADAILRTLWRLAASRRHLLEWTSAALTTRRLGGRLTVWKAWRQMALATAVAGLTVPALAWLRPGALPAAAPLLALWISAPAWAAWTARRPLPRRETLRSHDRQQLLRDARRTWAFFDRFMGPGSRWLPPDNHQEEPGPATADRTSPTNIGLGLLSALAAHDLGFIGPRDLVARIRSALDTLAGLDRFRGHFFNWYSISRLEPLHPRYVSTVDSGNLAVCLLALARGLEEVAAEPEPLARTRRGWLTTLEVVDELVAGLGSRSVRLAVGERIAALRQEVARHPEPGEWLGLLSDEGSLSLEPLLAAVADAVEEEADLPASRIHEIREWLGCLHGDLQRLRAEVRALVSSRSDPDARSATTAGSNPASKELREGLEALVSSLDRLVDEMDFGFLFHEDRHLLSIGFDADRGSYDSNYYDLLASETRLTSFFGIATGSLPAAHWLYLGRLFGRSNGDRPLLSWGGTTFEYFMPALLMKHPEGTLMEEGCRVAVRRHVEFARQLDIPWGMSESAYFHLDHQLQYQYRAFGVPGLGLRRDLGDRLVVAPYASILALPFAPRQVAANLSHLRSLEMLGPFGFYEAVDFGLAAEPPPRRPRRVRAYMSHHQGMALVALANCLTGAAMVRRFHRERRIASIEHFLFEHPIRAPAVDLPIRKTPRQPAPAPPAQVETWRVPPDGPVPHLQVLSNRHLSSLVTAKGGGGLRWRGLDVTRFEIGPGGEARGRVFYLQDLDSGELWSVGEEPTGVRPMEIDVRFGPHKVEVSQQSHELGVRLQVVVPKRDDIELRRFVLRNRSRFSRRLALTSFAELVLAPHAEARRHPAFQKLFVEAEALSDDGVLLFRRRPKNAEERPVFVAQTVVVPDGLRLSLCWETDRERFLGRGRSPKRPAALEPNAPRLEGRGGAPLDSAMVLGLELDLGPYQATELAFLTAIGESREAALRTLERYRSFRRIELAVAQAEVQHDEALAVLGLDTGDVRLGQELLSRLLASRSHVAAAAGDPPSGGLQERLWSLGISGDRPLVVMRVNDSEEIDTVQRLLRVHALAWRRGLPWDLVVLDTRSSGYSRPLLDRLQQTIQEVARLQPERPPEDIVALAELDLAAEQAGSIDTAARLRLDTSRGSLEDQLRRLDEAPSPQLPPFVPVPGAAGGRPATPGLVRPADLLFDNGWGGFSPDGREYVLHLIAGQLPPAPWTNVIANPSFGCLVTEAGPRTTWALNSGENRLTPWSNDPVTDPPGEALYLRDEETGRFWSPTPGPCPDGSSYQVRHGIGYSTFVHFSQGLRQEVRIFVAAEAPAKLVVIELEDLWARPRRLTATYFAEWVLGTNRETHAPFVWQTFDPAGGCLLAGNPWTRSFGDRVAFLTASRPVHGMTGDRRELLGPGGDPAHPAALTRIGLSGRVGPVPDPAAALQVHIDLPAGKKLRCHFVLGQGEDRAEALDLARRLKDDDAVDRAWREMEEGWNRILESIQVRTPDAGLDLLVNRWLVYQTISARLWGRTAAYQSSGAFGFRDQLQDVSALTLAAPELARAHLLEAARHQFEEGDVLHWWHPPERRGVRTRCSDDLLWLPFVTASYVESTGDRQVLDESVPFLTAPELDERESERYAEFGEGRSASLYEHCLAAIERGTTAGAQGLPLIGTSDWNDGFDRVGHGGRGESVWLGWFLHSVLTRFASLCELEDEPLRARQMRERAEALRGSLEAHGWDGAWYRRAFFDDGTPLGSAENDEGRIDLIAQTWAVLSGAADPERARQGMETVWQQVLDRSHDLLPLLVPPFDRTALDPGYIKGYPPGIRENGGQYNHAAAWAGWAFADLGNSERALQTFDLVNPIARASRPAGAERYRVEPYVVAGDIGAGAFAGRGGWSWYTGAAAWLYRLAVERILGLKRRGDSLEIDPRLPGAWSGFEARIRPPGAGEVLIVVERGSEDGERDLSLTVDGEPQPRPVVPLPEVGTTRRVRVVLAARRQMAPDAEPTSAR